MTSCHTSIWQALDPQPGFDPGTLNRTDGRAALRKILRLWSKIIGVVSSSDSMVDRDAMQALEADLEAWAITFDPKPDIVNRAPDPKSETGYTETIWFADDTCAMACLYFRMSNILLLMHAPNALNSNAMGSDWLRTYRLLCSKMADHARVILSIALGRPSQAVMAHMLQPLYLAGRCLWQEHEQRTVVSLLQQIEKELGLATNYRIKALLKEWGTSGSTGYSGLDAELSDLSN
jgi:hypothetical protein